jgi:hypothetical protein
VSAKTAHTLTFPQGARESSIPFSAAKHRLGTHFGRVFGSIEKALLPVREEPLQLIGKRDHVPHDNQRGRFDGRAFLDDVG